MKTSHTKKLNHTDTLMLQEKMKTTCTCFADTLARAKEHFKEEVGEVTEFDASWKGYSYFLTGDFCPVNPEIELTYRELKGNRQPKANLTKKLIKVTCGFCPMCGRKLAKDGNQS